MHFSNPRRRRRRGYRRNPGFSPGNILGTVVRVGKKTVAVVAGKALTNLASNAIPFGNGNQFTVAAKRLAVAILLGTIGRRFVGGENAELMMVGGFLPVVEGLAMNVPVIGPALNAPPVMLAVPGVQGYSRGVNGYSRGTALRGVGAYGELGVNPRASIQSPL